MIAPIMAPMIPPEFIALGIDLGGTKIESQLFDQEWNIVERQRVATPSTYVDLVQALVDQIAWADKKVRSDKNPCSAVPTGIGVAGLIHSESGHALTANLCATGKPLPQDVSKQAGRLITYVNDCRAFTLSEAVFGAGKGADTLLGLVLGTGIGGGICINGKLLQGPTQTGGEFGHMSASAALVGEHDLPLHRCGCGAIGCIETYVAGAGLKQLAASLISRELDPRQIAERRLHDPEVQQVWNVWCELAADMLRNLILAVDPDKIVLGGGLSRIDGVVEALSESLQMAQIGDFTIPPIVLAEGGDSSGARGAAYAAWQMQGHASASV